MTRIERIEYMEAILNKGSAAVGALRQALEDYTQLAEKLNQLFDYYGSEQWFSDLEADNAGLLPEDLCRGVLSEDAVYDLISENTELLDELSGFAQL